MGLASLAAYQSAHPGFNSEKSHPVRPPGKLEGRQADSSDCGSVSVGRARTQGSVRILHSESADKHTQKLTVLQLGTCYSGPICRVLWVQFRDVSN